MAVANKFNIGYGVHFDVTNPTQYIYFADQNKNLNRNAVIMAVNRRAEIQAAASIAKSSGMLCEIPLDNKTPKDLSKEDRDLFKSLVRAEYVRTGGSNCLKNDVLPGSQQNWK